MAKPLSKGVSFSETTVDSPDEFVKMSDMDDDKDMNDDDINDVIESTGETLIIDTGTSTIKYGKSSSFEPNIYNTINLNEINSLNDQPIINGLIKNWDDVVNLWKECIQNKLKLNFEEHALVMTEPYNITRNDREKLIEIIFEELGTFGCYVSPSNLFSLYGTGRTSGMVVDIAYDISRIVPIYEGYVLTYQAKNFKYSGQHINSKLAQLIHDNNKGNNNITESLNMNIIEDIKKRFSIVNRKPLINDNNLDSDILPEIVYSLPDNKILKLRNNEHVLCNEYLFKCKDNNRTFVETIVDCLFQTKPSSLNTMMENIVLNGGTSKTKNISKRLLYEINNEIDIQDNTDNLYEPHIICVDNPSTLAWKGASIFSQLPSFTDAFITYTEYHECGSRIVHAKCL